VPAPRLLRSIVLAAALGAAVAVVLALAANLPATLSAIGRFQWRLVPLVVAAVLVNYALRFLKWHFYLGCLDIPLRWRPSALVFLSGFTMAVTPGKFGELLKAFLVRDLAGTEVSRTASVVMAERLTDVAGLLVLSAFGAAALPHGRVLLGLVTVTLVAVIVVLRTPRLTSLARRSLPEHPLLARIVEPIRLFLRSGRALLTPRVLTFSVAVSVVSWFFECLALYLILHGLGAAISLRVATFLYAFASLAGALSMLPGGLGVAEGSLTGLLVGLGTAPPNAAAATLLVRAATLWLAVGLGVTTLLAAFRGGPAGSERPVS
jgi:uncharacterized protein (TIRG00374 family)